MRMNGAGSALRFRFGTYLRFRKAHAKLTASASSPLFFPRKVYVSMKLTSGQISISLALIVATAVCWQPRASYAQQQSGDAQAASATPSTSAPDLQVVILEGEDGVNVIKKNTVVKPVVQVRDKNKAPGAAVIAGGVAGAVVLFELPEKGATGTFANGAHWAQVTTDADGRAVSPEFHLVGKGSFQIQIRASYQGQTITRSITQTNFSTIAQAQKAGKTPGSSTHDNVSNESNQEANASQGASSSSAGSTAASSAASAGAAGGHAALITGVVVAGAAAAAGGAYYVSKNLNSSPDCSSQITQLENDLTNEQNICSQVTSSPAACVSAVQQSLNELGSWCSCMGSVANINNYPGYSQLISELQTAAQQEGLTLPSSCGY